MILRYVSERLQVKVCKTEMTIRRRVRVILGDDLKMRGEHGCENAV
jgi:hypothetical protein